MTASMDHTPAQANNLRQFLVLTLGSVGVVYGDIGTSPLYAFREALRPFAAEGVERGEVIGLISLMLWALTIIVTCKYVLFLLRADNDGEGGMLSLLTLLMKKAPRQTTIMLMAGILGAALFIGDAMITPALSVLSAVEGLKLVTPAFQDYDVPEGLRRNELDAGFYLGDPRDYDPSAEITGESAAPLFHARELAQLTYRVVAPPSLAGFVRGADWSQLASLPWIGTPQASVHNRLLSRLFADLGVRQNIVAQVDQETSMVAMVRTGVGLSLCRESIALHEQQAHGLVIAENVKISTTLSFLCLEARIGDPSIMAAFDAIRRVWI